MEMDLNNMTVVVTGATSGIGLAAVTELARAGARVIGVGRSVEHCRDAEAQLRGLKLNNRVNYLLADLGKQADVLQLAQQIKELLAGEGRMWLDGLVNNAGVFTYWMTLTPDGLETQWAVNHMAAFLLTRELLPLLKAAPFARVVTVSSGSHHGARINRDDPQLRRHYNGLQAYGNTKLANILFTLELNRRLGDGSNVRAFALDPGLVRTEIGMKGTPALAGWVWKIRRSGGTPPETPARGIYYLLTEASIQASAEVYWKDSRPLKPGRNAQDGQTASWLWSLSERMCATEKGDAS